MNQEEGETQSDDTHSVHLSLENSFHRPFDNEVPINDGHCRISAKETSYINLLVDTLQCCYIGANEALECVRCV